MQKFLRSIVTAIVSSFLFFFGSIYILMEIGLSRHGNYEYYGRYFALYVVPGLFGLIFPTLLAWLMRKFKEPP